MVKATVGQSGSTTAKINSPTSTGTVTRVIEGIITTRPNVTTS